MSLSVPPSLVEQAQAGDISDEDFIACIRDSLPYAWSVITETAAEINEGKPFAINGHVPPSDDAWGQLFRLVASDSMRGAVERHFGAKLAFQNCCRAGLFTAAAESQYREFISPRAQVLNQKPELLNC